MPSLTVSALLTDAAGAVLLVRRKRSALWSLPGGEISVTASISGMLLSLCRRQVGVTPDFIRPFYTFEFSGRRVIVGQDDVRHEQARACGWIESVQWCRPEALPVGTDPLAAVAISLRNDPKVLASAQSAMVDAVMIEV